MTHLALRKSVALAILILVAAAVMASAGGAGSASAAGVGTAGQEKVNAVAIPLDVRENWAAQGFTFTAQGLAQSVGLPSVSQVLRLNPVLQGYDSWFPAGGFGFVNGSFVTEPFALEVGQAYRLVLNDADATLTKAAFIGSVPAPGAISTPLYGAGSGCKFSDLMIPLDQSSMTNASQLAESMGGIANVEQVLRLNPTLQGYDSWFPGGGFGFVNGGLVTDPFSTTPGHPYTVCLKSSANGQLWP